MTVTPCCMVNCLFVYATTHYNLQGFTCQERGYTSEAKSNGKNHVSYSSLTESFRIHVYVVQYVIYMVRCDVQRWNMQKQIDATRYIVPYKKNDRMSIIVLRYARRPMRTVSQGRLTL